MLFLFQSLIIFAVVASNMHWQWTPNGYLPSLVGVGLAYVERRAERAWETVTEGPLGS